MAHIVTCTICKKKFDRDEIDAVSVSSRRYAHKLCYDAGCPQEIPKSAADVKKEENKKLKEYIQLLYGERANWVLIQKQIKDFKNRGYTYKDMYFSLKYFYEVKGNNTAKSNGGIGIIDYCFTDAKNYFSKLNQKRDINKEAIIIDKIKVITIKSIKDNRIKMTINMDWEENDEEHY